MEILIGAAGGAATALLCALIYRKGLRDGMKQREKSHTKFEDLGAEAENELMKKYAALLNYDPYGGKS